MYCSKFWAKERKQAKVPLPPPAHWDGEDDVAGTRTDHQQRESSRCIRAAKSNGNTLRACPKAFSFCPILTFLSNFGGLYLKEGPQTMANPVFLFDHLKSCIPQFGFWHQ